MDALECLFSRRTALGLTGPAPTPAQLETILRAATLAPDHKKLRPWRFVVIRGDGRTRLGEAMAAALLARNAEAAPEMLDRVRRKPLRAPLSIVVIASPKDPPIAPLWEQLASAAAACQNICLAAEALGLGSGWKSTPLGDSPPLREFLSMKDGEELFGIMELGQFDPSALVKPRAEVDLATVVTEIG